MEEKRHCTGDWWLTCTTSICRGGTHPVNMPLRQEESESGVWQPALQPAVERRAIAGDSK